jgi:hypothetical protein
LRLLYDAGDCPNANPKRDCVSYTYAYSHGNIYSNAYAYPGCDYLPARHGDDE